MRRLKRDFPQHFHEGIRTHLVASGIAGFCCSAASNPIDVIKVRIMSDRTGQYRGSLHCAALLLKNEGPSASLFLLLSLFLLRLELDLTPQCTLSCRPARVLQRVQHVLLAPVAPLARLARRL